MGPWIVNQTTYLTEDLRALVRACLQHCGASNEREVTVVYSRRACISGNGELPRGGRPGFRIRLRLPRPQWLDAQSGRDERWLLLYAARVLEHEITHTLGLKHRQMRNDIRKCTQDVQWAEGLRIRLHADEVAFAPGTCNVRDGSVPGAVRPRLGAGPTAQIAVRIPEPTRSTSCP